jgi:hypothetical protein
VVMRPRCRSRVSAVSRGASLALVLLWAASCAEDPPARGRVPVVGRGDVGPRADAAVAADTGGPRDAEGLEPTDGGLDDGGRVVFDAQLADTGVGAPDVLPGSDVPATALDASAADASAPDAAARDASAPDASAPDAGGPIHIHIHVSNTCDLTVDPPELSFPRGVRPRFAWHNHSVDYPVDVWMSYGGGFLDLGTGATWNEPIDHCLGPNAHDEWADISAGGCAEFRFLIHCL